MSSQVTLFTTSVTTTAKLRADIQTIKTLLAAKGAAYEEVDLVMQPERREAMLAASGGVRQLPQVHVNGKYIGDADTLQTLEDRGELQNLLEGASQ